jgi:hypothetical protein
MQSLDELLRIERISSLPVSEYEIYSFEKIAQARDVFLSFVKNGSKAISFSKLSKAVNHKKSSLLRSRFANGPLLLIPYDKQTGGISTSPIISPNRAAYDRSVYVDIPKGKEFYDVRCTGQALEMFIANNNWLPYVASSLDNQTTVMIKRERLAADLLIKDIGYYNLEDPSEKEYRFAGQSTKIVNDDIIIELTYTASLRNNGLYSLLLEVSHQLSGIENKFSAEFKHHNNKWNASYSMGILRGENYSHVSVSDEILDSSAAETNDRELFENAIRNNPIDPQVFLKEFFRDIKDQNFLNTLIYLNRLNILHPSPKNYYTK